MLKACKSTLVHISGGTTSDPRDSGLCIGLLNGVYDAITTKSQMYSDIEICLPNEKIRLDVGIELLISYLESNRDKLDLKRSNLAYLAFYEKYPCEDNESKL